MNGTAIRDAVCAVLVLLAVAMGVTMCMHSTGCAAPPRVLNAVEIAEWTLPYGAELDLCREEAKKLPRPQRWDAYLKCEDVATQKTCAKLPMSSRVQWRQCEVPR